ncbi:hypothetical protein [Stenotrophomonas sp.]|uniref:hypothetical protein n=1 Tax=Stenotrophomonas sp. TaxID=69392 RepID=UPI002FC93E4E
MKWREPWGVSLRQQGRFNPLSAPVRKTFLTLLVPFTALWLMGSWRSASGFQEALMASMSWIWILPVLAAAIAVFVCLMTWLCPREFDVGPNGILLTKVERGLLVPWSAVASHRFMTVDGDAALEITTISGEALRLFLSSTVSRAAIEREIAQHMRMATA